MLHSPDGSLAKGGGRTHQCRSNRIMRRGTRPIGRLILSTMCLTALLIVPSTCPGHLPVSSLSSTVNPQSSRSQGGSQLSPSISRPVPVSGPVIHSKRTILSSGPFSTHSISVGAFPQNLIFDSVNNLTYVPVSSGWVSVIDGTSVVGNISAGTYPQYGTFDSLNGEVYVLNRGSDNVTIISGTTQVGTVQVGTAPIGACFDPVNGYVYVANSGSSDVSILNGTIVVATVHVGKTPQDAVYDPSNGWVYVPTPGSDIVTVFDGTSVVGTVTGISPSN